jgi:hypothetical protein
MKILFTISLPQGRINYASNEAYFNQSAIAEKLPLDHRASLLIAKLCFVL